MLGPMVFGACLVEASDEPALLDLGARDSKKISRIRRGKLRIVLEDFVAAWRTLSFSPEEIDNNSLNELGKIAVVRLALELKPDVLVVDAPVPPRGIPAYRAELSRRLGEGGVGSVRVIAENGADDRYPCCSAASIFAKTTRDQILSELEEKAGESLGSGYPGDQKTIAYLQRVWDRDGHFPPFVRTKWETVRRIVAKPAQGSLF